MAGSAAGNIISGLGNLGRSALMLANAAVKAGGTVTREIASDPLAAAGRASHTKAGGITQMAAGGAIAAAGVPMLILPGPGIAAIAGGAALAANGAKTVFGKTETHEPRYIEVEGSEPGGQSAEAEEPASPAEPPAQPIKPPAQPPARQPAQQTSRPLDRQATSCAPSE